jgi:hypothetical protein
MAAYTAAVVHLRIFLAFRYLACRFIRDKLLGTRDAGRFLFRRLSGQLR